MFFLNSVSNGTERSVKKVTSVRTAVFDTGPQSFCHSFIALFDLPPSATVVSAEPFSHGTGTLRCLQKEMATCRHWSVYLWRDPNNVSHYRILSPDKTELQLISTTLSGWRCCFVADQLCFVADQLWFMTCIREEENCPVDNNLFKVGP